jgi:hypothetical protein
VEPDSVRRGKPIVAQPVVETPVWKKESIHEDLDADLEQVS